MKREVICAQGEITVFHVEGSLPDGLIPHTEKDRNGRPIISHSEKGNHHVLAGCVDVLELSNPPEGMRILYALLDHPVDLIQDAPDAHEKHSLKPGWKEFRIAREFDPFSEQTRQVAD